MGELGPEQQRRRKQGRRDDEPVQQQREQLVRRRVLLRRQLGRGQEESGRGQWELWTGEMVQNNIQGISKRLFPGCVKSGEKVAFCLPNCRQENAIFSPHIHTTWEAFFRGSLY